MLSVWWTLMGCVLIVILMNIVAKLWEKFFADDPIDITLYVREPQSNTEMMLEGVSSNIFYTEMNKMMLKIVPIVDFSVMKYVGQDVPLIHEQEYAHAKMHRAGCKEEIKVDKMNRFDWLYWVMDLLYLRCGPLLGLTMCGLTESGSVAGFYTTSLFQGALTNLLLFHAFEEAEHSTLTVQCIGGKVNIMHRLLAIPMALMGAFMFWWSPIFFRIGREPSILLKPKTYSDLITHCIMAVFCSTAFFLAVIVFWVFGFNESTYRYKSTYNKFKKMISEKNIQFEVKKMETYVWGVEKGKWKSE